MSIPAHAAARAAERVLALINSRPRTPSVGEIADAIAAAMADAGAQGGMALAASSPLIERVRRAIAAAKAAALALNTTPLGEDEGDEREVAQAEERATEEILALEAVIPNPATAPDELLALAMLANYWIAEYEDADFEQPENRLAFRLAQGFLACAEGAAEHAPPCLPPRPFGENCRLFRLRRSFVAVLADLVAARETTGEEAEARLDDVCERGDRLAEAIWSAATSAASEADIALLAEVALFYGGGAMAAYQNQNAARNTRAFAELVVAILRRAGSSTAQKRLAQCGVSTAVTVCPSGTPSAWPLPEPCRPGA
ncbi:MAG TPA: hypothetical protein VNK52_14350 [Hyphomicrobiaceae bacterium]|nr:hypothetical protein [Hyphomicrobiaceae bacterium]